MFAILEEVVPDRPGEGATRKVDTCTGQPGMEQWKILVLGSLRLGLNADYSIVIYYQDINI
jgi:IS5 family transposase